MRLGTEFESGHTVAGRWPLSGSGEKEPGPVARSAAAGTVSETTGDDVLVGGPGFDWINGGDGTDEVDYVSAVRPVAVVLGGWWGGLALGRDIGFDWLSGIENVTGGAGGDVLVGNGNANVLVGHAGDDRIDGRGGDDLLTGGFDADTFVFGKRFGHDTVTDFDAQGDDHDVIEVSRAAFADFAAISAAMEQVGADVVITLDADNSITLENTLLDDLDASDFHFADGMSAPWQGSVLSVVADLLPLAWWRSPHQALAAAGVASPDPVGTTSDPVTPDHELPAAATNDATTGDGGAGAADATGAASTTPISEIFQNTGFELFLSGAELELFVLRVEMLRAAGYDVPG